MTTTMVHLTDSIANRTVVRQLDQLEEMIRKLGALEAGLAPPSQLQRPGWLRDQVLAVLQNSDTPLSAKQVCDVIYERTGTKPNNSSVRWVLRYGREAKLGDITNVQPGRYETD